MPEIKHDPGNANLVLLYREHLKQKNYAKQTIDQYFTGIIKFLLWTEKDLNKSIKEITKRDILDYKSYLKQKKLSINTVDSSIRSIKVFFKWLEDNLYILLNPWDNIILPRPPQPIPTVLTEKEITKLINQPNVSTYTGIRDRAMIEVLYSTGIRLEELRGLSIFDVDTQSGFLRVTKGKFSKDRFCPLTKASCWWLKEYLNKVRPRLTKNKPKQTSLFIGRTGKRINRLSIIRLIKRYGEEAGIKKKVTTHVFRHTLAVHMLENGTDIFSVQKLLGHAHLDTTQRYTSVVPKQIKHAHSTYHPRERSKANDE